MVDAPENIWLSGPNNEHERGVWFDPDEGGTKYVHADLYDQVKQTLAIRDKESDFLKRRGDKAIARAEALEAENAKLKEDKERLDFLRTACGYVEDGSNERVVIMQDDATKEWLVRVGSKWPSHGASLRQAIDVTRRAREGGNADG